MSAKDPPVARRAASLEQLTAFAEKLRRSEKPSEAPAQPRCDCVPYGTCPVCTARRGQSVPHDEDGE